MTLLKKILITNYNGLNRSLLYVYQKVVIFSVTIIIVMISRFS